VADESAFAAARITTLLAHRRFLDECRFAGSRERDTAILTIAGGSLAVSVAFMERVVPILDPASTLVLACGWVCEIVAIILVLRSHHTSEAALDIEINRVNTMVACGGGDDPGWPNRMARQTARLNVWASAATVLGLIIMLTHAAVSLYVYGGTKMKTVDSQPITTAVEKPNGTTAGFVPPTPPPTPPPDSGKK
jgi:hypothetical protein